MRKLIPTLAGFVFFASAALVQAQTEDVNRHLQFGLPAILVKGALMADSMEHLNQAIQLSVEHDAVGLKAMVNAGSLGTMPQAGIVIPERRAESGSGIVEVRVPGRAKNVFVDEDFLHPDVPGYAADHADAVEARGNIR